MVNDIDILSMLKNRDKYERFYPFVKENFLTREGEALGGSINKYFKEDVLKSIPTLDWSKFSIWFFLKNTMMNHDMKANYKDIFSTLTSHVVDTVYEQSIVEMLTVKSYASNIGKLAMSIADGSSEDGLDTIGELVDEGVTQIRELDVTEDPHQAHATMDFLFNPNANNAQLLEFSLGGLRDACTGVRKGDFVILGAHPDSGKSTFLMSEAAHFLKQLPDDKVILYLNNEQSSYQMLHRLLSAVLSVPDYEIELDPLKYTKKYKDLGGDRIILFDGCHTTKFIEQRIQRYEGRIGAIMIDQLWKVRSGGNGKGNEFLQLASTFAWARELAKKHAPVITAHQCDGTSLNEQYPDMGSLYGSRVAMQGEADAIIMLGRDPTDLDPTLRYIGVPKNKLKAKDPTARNNRFVVKIDHELVKFNQI